MDTKLLRSFIAIVENGTLSAAARQLFIAQPALSRQLKTLETELDAVLFDRASRRPELTPAGRLFYEKAKYMLSLETAAKKEVRDLGQGENGCLRAAMTPSTAITMFDGLLAAFFKERPHLRCELHETDSGEVLRLLQNGIVDFGVVRTPCPITPQMAVRFISGERMVAAFDPAYFSLGSPGEAVPLFQLEGKPVVVIKRYEELFVHACREKGIVPNLRCVNVQLAVSLKWAQCGLGIAIVPLSSLDAGGTPLQYRVIDEPSFSTRRALVTMKGGYRSPVCSAFLSFCEQALEKMKNT